MLAADTVVAPGDSAPLQHRNERSMTRTYTHHVELDGAALQFRPCFCATLFLNRGLHDWLEAGDAASQEFWHIPFLWPTRFFQSEPGRRAELAHGITAWQVRDYVLGAECPTKVDVLTGPKQIGHAQEQTVYGHGG